MGYLLILGGLLVLWLFTSKTKSKDIKSAVKFTKEAKKGAHKLLEDADSSYSEFSKNFESSVAEFSRKSEEKVVKQSKDFLLQMSKQEDIDKLNENSEAIGIGRYDDVTNIVDYFKEKDRFDEISHLVIKENKPERLFSSSKNAKYFINREYGKYLKEKEKAEREKKVDLS